MILIVEDDLTLASSIEDTLMHFGYDTKVVESVEEAIKVIKVTPPRLIISDILLGDHDGFYLLQFVRAVPQFDAIGFIFISALIETSFVVKGLQCGADDYIRKPFQIEELKTRVETILRKNKMLVGAVQKPVEIIIPPFEPKEQVKISPSKDANQKESFMEVLNDVMDKNLSDKSLTPEKLSHMFKMNDHNFKKLVRKHTGMTVSGFIKHYKWKRAKDVLISKGGNVHEASDALGFINYNYFITKFRDMYDETPKQYFLRIMSLKEPIES